MKNGPMTALLMIENPSAFQLWLKVKKSGPKSASNDSLILAKTTHEKSAFSRSYSRNIFTDAV